MQTNAMAYPKCITPQMQKDVKLVYSMKQFAATLACISEDAALPWGTLFAIQGAPLLMTLVRKGKISSIVFHRSYIFQLVTPMYVFLLGNILHWNDPTGVVQESTQRINLVAALHRLTTRLRITYGCSKLVTWATSTAILVAVSKVLPLWQGFTWLHTHPLGIAIVVFRHVMLGQKVLRHYVPIFTLQNETPPEWPDVDVYARTASNIVRSMMESYAVRVGMVEKSKCV